MLHRFLVHNKHIDVEFDGPYDKQLWAIRRVQLGPQYEAAVVGNGVDMRSAADSALRALLKTPYETYKAALTQEINLWFNSLEGVDVRQGDSVVRLYCIIKVVK